MELVEAPSQRLLERESELAEFDAAIAVANAGTPSVLVVEGPAGIGKTELLRVARERSETEGIAVLAARGGELERELGFGVARQLFEPVLVGASAEERARLLEGPAVAVAALFGLGPAGANHPADEFTIQHGLYWLCARLAERAPLMLVADDLQWCDADSLRWLAYLIRRHEDLPVIVAMARRTDEATANESLLAGIAGEASVRRVRPRKLSAGAVSGLIRERFEAQPEEEFARACHRVAGGNPLFTLQLIEEARARGLRPLDLDAEPVARLAPERVSQLAVDRLRRCSDTAVAVAEEMAILGAQAEVRHVASLSELTTREVLEAADELAAAGLAQPAQPLEFVHPIIRSATHGSIPAGRRAAAHERAARMLDDEGAEPAQVATHLLAVPPAADPWVVKILVEVASAAALPEAAASYLRRAAAEPPSPADRADLLLALGEAEARTYDPAAIGHLEEALRLAGDPPTRAAAAVALADPLVQDGRAVEAEPILRAAIAEVSATPPDRAGAERSLLLGLQSELLHAELVAGALTPARLVEAIAVAGAGESPAELELLAMAAYVAPAAGATADEVAAMAERTLAGGRMLEMEKLLPAQTAIWALEFAGRYEEADRWLLAVIAEAHGRGSPSQFMLAGSARAGVAYRRGALADAEQEARTALELARAHERDYGASVSTAALVAALTEQGRLDQAEAALDSVEGAGARCDLAVYLEQRGWLRLAQGEPATASEEFRRAGGLMREAGHDFPGFSDWRLGLSRAALARGESGEAAALAREQLGRVRHFGAPGSIGTALRALGLAEGGSDGLELLAEAVAHLERSSACLERAKANLELGAALRRAGKRTASREPLREALDLADRCGATPVVARAREELVAAGARPRRTRIGGIEALTASELRVARRAAAGRTNREIAQELMVTKKAVEKHLASTYRKLEIEGRNQLPATLTE